MRKIPTITRTAISIAIATAFTSPISFAQDNNSNKADAGRQLPQVEVVGTSPLPGIGIEKNKLPYDVQTINSDEINNSANLNLSDFMNQNLLGVNVSDIQGSPFQGDVTYRGFRASGILGASQGLSVYLDGVRINESFGDVVNWDMIPEAAISNMTLVPGSNPVYGLNTLGGALAFTTKSGLTHQGTETKLQLGSFGRKRVDVSHGSKSDDGKHTFIAATGFDETGWRDESSGQLGNVFVKTGQSNAQTNWNVSFLTGRSRLLGNGLLPSFNYGADGDDPASAGLYETSRKAIYTHPDRTINQVNMLTFNLQHMLDGNSEISANAYIKHSKRTGLNGDADQLVAGPPIEVEAELNRSNTSQTSYGASANLTKIISDHQMTIGTSLDASKTSYLGTNQQNCEFDASRGAVDCSGTETAVAKVSGRSYAMSVYGMDTWKIGSATYLTGAARLNHAKVTNTLNSDPTESFTYNKLNPSLGFATSATEKLTVFGNVAQSNRVPTVIELGCASDAGCLLPTGLQADPYLKQVVAQTIEGGVKWAVTDKSSFNASVYRTDNKDDILFRSVDPTAGTGKFVNFSKTRYQGVDAALFTDFGTTSLKFKYSYLDATYQSTENLFGGDRLIPVSRGTKMAGLPDHTLKVIGEWKAMPKLVIGSTLHITSKIVSQGNEDGNIANGALGDAGVKGYQLIHVHANYAAQKGLDYFARINNLFDRKYETYGQIAHSFFDQNGSPVDPSVAPDGNISRFVAPGAPRSFMVGLRYRY